MVAPDTSHSGLRETNTAEHISDAKAKKVVLRMQDPATGNWVNLSAIDVNDGTFALNVKDARDFDYIGIVNDSATQDTLTYKTGGSGGTTVRTLVITYAASASKISDDLASLAFS